MKKKLIGSVLVIVSILVILGVVSSIITNNKNSYSKVVGDYADTDFVNKWEALGDSYSIGMNSKGYPIFKNVDVAFEQAKEDFSEGFDYLYKIYSLPKLSKKLSVLEKYKQEAIQANPPITVQNYEEVAQQCLKIAQFVDVYENSFK